MNKKGVCLYDYMNNFNKFDGDPLPDKNRILQFLSATGDVMILM